MPKLGDYNRNFSLECVSRTLIKWWLSCQSFSPLFIPPSLSPKIINTNYKHSYSRLKWVDNQITLQHLLIFVRYLNQDCFGSPAFIEGWSVIFSLHDVQVYWFMKNQKTWGIFFLGDEAFASVFHFAIRAFIDHPRLIVLQHFSLRMTMSDFEVLFVRPISVNQVVSHQSIGSHCVQPRPASVT